MKRDNQSNKHGFDAFKQALESLCNRTMNDSEREMILEGLRSEPEKRRLYIQAMAVEAMLCNEFPSLEHSDRGLMEIAAVPGEVADAVPVAHGQKVREVFTSARITRFDSTSAISGGLPLGLGVRLEPGLLELSEGSIEVTFDSGAVVSLLGPARLNVESAFRARLLEGRAAAWVPQQAVGFLMLTPGSYPCDPGKVFAVNVDNRLGAEVHVLEGSVGSSRTFGKKGAVRPSGKGGGDIGFDKSKLPPIPELRHSNVEPAVCFSFDRWTKNRTKSPTGHDLELFRHDAPAEPVRVEGVSGSALRFDGRGMYGRTNFLGVGGDQPRTVAFWIRLDPSVPSDPLNPNGVVAWGVNRPARKWQVCWNTLYKDGALGALRVELGIGHVVGATDLRDGRWHHVAVVFLGGENADVSTHIRLYVDGRLERMTGRLQQRIATDTVSGKAAPMIIGRYLGRWKNREHFYFQGDLDEVRVYDEAILPSDIVGIMKEHLKEDLR